ncbi:MAG: alpha/beta hydrolase [Microthrixaceae bacterium]
MLSDDFMTPTADGTAARRFEPRYRVTMAHRTARSLLAAPAPVLDRIIGAPPIVLDGRVLDRRVQALLAIGERLMPGDGSRSFDPDQRRREMDRMATTGMPSRQGLHVSERRIPGPESTLAVRVYRPFGLEPDPPALLYIHGGGWVVGSLDAYDGTCRLVAAEARCVVVSVDYRLAPEHPFPAPLDDSLAAYHWVRTHARELGIDGRRVGVMGDSAGGNLAAVLAQVTLDDPVGPPQVQALIYPATEASFSKPSHELFAEGFGLTRVDMEWYRAQYLPDRSTWDLPTVSPLLAPSVEGVAPAVVATAGFDPLRDEGSAYAERLSDAGVPVWYRCYDDMIHGFFGMGVIPECLGMATEIARATARPLHQT